MTTVSTPIASAFWSFDDDLTDLYSGSSGISVNNVSYYTPGITGYGATLCFNSSANQSLVIPFTDSLNISVRSFTFELWVYPFSLAINSSGDRGMIGQCGELVTDKCLHMTIRINKVRISFFNNSCTGTTVIVTNTWYHFAFVYNFTMATQTIYLNGIPHCNLTSSTPLQVTNSTALTIGMTYPLQPFYFDGLIDQVSFFGWAKNDSEIIDDATLVAYYSFNSNSLLDSGPNRINGTGVNLTFVNNSVVLNSTLSYFQASGFVLLGIRNRSYSFSLWINPFRTNGSTVVYVSGTSLTTGNWCIPFLGFDSQGRIYAQSRSSNGLVSVQGPLLSNYTCTHLGQTYSPTNGMNLYVNGSLFNISESFVYSTTNTPLTLTLGNSLSNDNNSCASAAIQTGQYWGEIDEFRLYSRELTNADVQILATN